MTATQTSALVACEERLCAFVRRHTGLRIHDHQLENLRRTMQEAFARFGHTSCDSYLRALESAGAASPEHEHLIAGITIGESYFFRDQSQMDFLRQVFLPELIERRRRQDERYLRIWSAGCSDGQELYSLAIILQQLLPDIDRWNLHLLGTDINAASLSRAMRGRYSGWSFRATPEALRQQYFGPDGDQAWQIAPQLRRRAKFSYLNLNEDSFPSILTETNSLDLILCRNVFIYFDPGVVLQIMAKLNACLVPGGCLLLGTSDLIDSAAQEGFELHALANAFYLIRGHDAPPDAGFAASRREIPPPEPAKRAAAAPLLPSAAGTPLAEPQEIIALLGAESWAQALQAITQRQQAGDSSAMIWQFRAKALANLGRRREALAACDQSLAIDPADKHTHFIRALVLLELNRLPAAEDALRRTLYLDRNFAEAHFQLGLLQLRRDRRPAGLKSLRNALAIADTTAPDRRLHDAAGMNHGRMAAILRNELEIYQQLPGGKKK